jgi:hypothetical protein
MSIADRTDAGESMYLSRQLESILPETKDVLYREMKSKSLVPVNSRHAAGTKNITWRSASKQGRAKIVAAYGATDIPSVSRAMTEQSLKVHSVASKASWSKHDVREAQMAGIPLQSDLTRDAGEANALTIDQAVLLGDTEHGINGLLNYPGLTSVTIPADGTGSSKLWSTKTGTLILRDIGNMVKAITVTTNGVEKPNTLLLPLSVFTDLSLRPWNESNSSDKTVLAYLTENLRTLGITSIEGVVELETAGASSGTRAFLYTKDPRKVEQHIPLVLDTTPPQPDGLLWNVFFESRFAGTTFYYLLSASVGDGI